jgi:hypothetical protein
VELTSTTEENKKLDDGDVKSSGSFSEFVIEVFSFNDIHGVIENFDTKNAQYSSKEQITIDTQV